MIALAPHAPRARLVLSAGLGSGRRQSDPERPFAPDRGQRVLAERPAVTNHQPTRNTPRCADKRGGF